jgi:hypothetical protein
MSKIIKNFEDVSYSINTVFSKELALFTVKAIVWSNAFYNKNTEDYECEICDIELFYKMDGKYCRREGFKELYNKLYGEDSFDKFEEDICKEFENEYYKSTTISKK